MKVVIIGGVAGGATAAARLRRLDESMEIIILERGEYISYANCGLPYYVGDVIKERENLILQTPEVMKARFNIDVRVKNEVVKINKEKKSVLVRGAQGEYEESYDELIISTGSSPIRPNIPGINQEGLYTLWDVKDVDKIRQVVDERKPSTAAIIGGGFIGLEMAENLHARGIKVALVEAANQVMASVDPEMAQLLHENMDMNGVSLFLNNGVERFEKNDDVISVILANKEIVKAEIIILAIGVKPNSELAEAAGLKLNQRKGIVVDEYMHTSQPNIWAVGDVIETEHRITGERTMIPLAGPANKQGRIVADNICGGKEAYKGTMGTSVAKVFDLTVAAVGLNEKLLQSRGKKKHRDYESILIVQKSHAGYYPMAGMMYLKMIFEKQGKILGAQIVGQDGVDKRIDVLASVIANGGTVESLKNLELSYAPPYSSAKDPVNMLGFTAENVIKERIRLTPYNELEGKVIVDITEPAERTVFSIPGSVHIPLGELRNRMKELPKDKELVVYCAIGVRSYNAARILLQSGFTKVSILEGGVSFYKSMNYISKAIWDNIKDSKKEQRKENLMKEAIINDDITVTEKKPLRILDCCGLQCPGPIMKVSQALSEMKEGDTICVSATDMGFSRDVESWCVSTGNTYMGAEKRGKENIVTIQKGKRMVAETEVSDVSGSNGAQGKTIIVFDGDMDKVMASLIIANGAASMGRKVTMFYTFWGLNALRKKNKVKVKKTILEKMFGMMMPRGLGKLKLSKLHMMGMGKGMMEFVMKEKNVASLEELMQQAMANGVKMIACTMSMDVMGIKKEELIDGVELAGVATYLGDAENSNVNLFI